jgi:hypothetical protein
MRSLRAKEKDKTSGEIDSAVQDDGALVRMTQFIVLSKIN